MKVLFQFFEILLLISIVKSHLSFRILQTSILHFIPAIKLHHIILLSDNPKEHLYTLDFTPINQTHTSTLIKMVLAQNVPAEIRLRYITTNIENIDTIIEKWDKMNKLYGISSKQLTNDFYTKIKNEDIKNIIEQSFEWKEYMNLYTHNCQHFSQYVKNITYPYLHPI